VHVCSSCIARASEQPGGVAATGDDSSKVHDELIDEICAFEARDDPWPTLDEELEDAFAAEMVQQIGEFARPLEAWMDFGGCGG
jgi:hypothetical protein